MWFFLFGEGLSEVRIIVIDTSSVHYLQLFQILDVVALEYCLLQLEPTPDDLENPKDRLNWCNRVQCIRPIMQVTKSWISRPLQQLKIDKDNESMFNSQPISTQRSAHYLQICRCVLMLLVLAIFNHVIKLKVYTVKCYAQHQNRCKTPKNMKLTLHK